MATELPLLQTRDLKAGYRSGSQKTVTIGGPLNLDIRPGQLICLLGPNGAGKSTLLRTLAGLQPTLGGTVAIGDVAIGQLAPMELAKKISLVLTDRVIAGNLTVYSLVALGRYPYSGWLGNLSDTDREIIGWAIEESGIGSLTHRKVHKLSDGENQKVMLARALAQDTPILMLDEPTAHLDLPSRIQLMQLLHRLARKTHKGILLSTHELDLALQVAGEVWLLQTGGRLHRGAPEDLVLEGVFEAAFVKEGIAFDKTAGTFTIHREGTEQVLLEGTGAAFMWTRRALQRQGFAVNTGTVLPGSGMVDVNTGASDVNSPETAAHSIFVSEKQGRNHWRLKGPGREEEYDNIAGLLSALRRVHGGNEK